MEHGGTARGHRHGRLHLSLLVRGGSGWDSAMKNDRIQITPATARERAWAANLLARSEPWTTLGVTLRQCRRNCQDRAYRLYVARVSGRPCGVLVLDPRGVAGSPYVKSIAVDPASRSRGIGAALMAFAERLSAARARHMFLCVSSFNRRARAFYRRLGYHQVGRFKDYIIAGADELLMHKPLR
jgi:[ribosomal protein S18]-alanine N-acetyltransferase